MLKVFAGLNHEIHHNVGKFGKIATLIIAATSLYLTVIWFIMIFVGGVGNPYIWLFFGALFDFVGQGLLQAAIFYAVYTGGVGIGD